MLHGGVMKGAPVGQTNAVQVLPAAVAVPDAHPLGLQYIGIRTATDEPQQLLHNTCWVLNRLIPKRT